jgi:antitoxin ChpS
MQKVQLRKVGGSVMLTLPRPILQLLGVGPGATVGLGVEAGRLIIDPLPKPRYSLDELLSQCDPLAPLSNEDRAWLADEAAGSELL